MSYSHWPSGRQKGKGLIESAAKFPPSSRDSIGGPSHKKHEVLKIIGVETSPALGTFERGAIIAPNLNIKGSGNHVELSGGEGYDPDLLRSSVLFFDKLDSPTQNIFGFGDLESLAGLDQIPGFGRSRVSLEGMISVDFQALSAAGAFDALNQREPGRWSISRSAQNSGLPSALFDKSVGLRIRIENAIPIPGREVSFDDILSFKDRRKSELMALRHHIDGIILEVANSEFQELTELVAYEKLILSLDDYYESIRPMNFKKRLMSLEISVSLNEAFHGAFGAMALAASSARFGFADLLATAGGVIALEKTVSLKRKVASPFPYEYLWRAGSEI